MRLSRVMSGCITILLQTQFDNLCQFLLAQETKAIPGTNIKYCGAVEVRRGFWRGVHFNRGLGRILDTVKYRHRNAK
ncbi:hypothetical protein FNF07_17375 [Trinickia caryophylli]|uniref:Uncharacterized protein n=1 Tax=Trinickia caryophylli TaxID=28094 RepID=A0A1X7CEG3_TRICW|nr:hypothetical protein C0Z17_09515 [Trinickia caryophylli]TRX19800.1 hypothetical protein FNF07_17375 [Trinickia caryophylli]SME95296.1 hypothetical protein SAMN06295900_101290 [Trinickia caryophylli]